MKLVSDMSRELAYKLVSIHLVSLLTRPITLIVLFEPRKQKQRVLKEALVENFAEKSDRRLKRLTETRLLIVENDQKSVHVADFL